VTISNRTVARLVFALALALPLSIRAQQPLPLAEADQRAAELFQQSGFTGMVMVIVRNGEVSIKGYGETYPGSGVRPDADSLLRLCSVSKVFTTDLLLKQVAEGKVSLDDPLQRFAPHGKLVPSGPAGQRITLLDLATHTSGLPREVSSYPKHTPHFTFPDKDFRWNWLPAQHLKSAPGTAAFYSNIGFDLLGDALASATHKSYAQLLSEQLLRPLALYSTTLVPSQQQCARLLRGNRDEGPCTDTQPSGPSGGLYSTPADMARFLGYLLRAPGYPAPPADDLAVHLTPAQLKTMDGLNHAGDPTGIGLAWIQLGDPATPSAIIEKTGGGAGFSTYLALSPSRQTGIFVAVTDGEKGWRIDLFHETNDLLAALANVPPLPPKAPKPHVSRKHKAVKKRRKSARS
jgi:D-alanyl-D-alanine-carboxypeptidase/D-alanyl-D-alanine-endopeptidase